MKQQRRNVPSLENGADRHQTSLEEDCLHPSTQAAVTIQKYTAGGEGSELDLILLTEGLQNEIAEVNGGDLRKMEALLVTQAFALNAVFGHLIRLGMPVDGQRLNSCDLFLRMALRAQSASRATVEALTALKNPPVIYARQANLTTGAQQINNAFAEPSHGCELENGPNKLLEVSNGERMDIGATGAAGRANQELEAVGSINRTED
jgi:hypothetical protein